MSTPRPIRRVLLAVLASMVGLVAAPLAANPAPAWAASYAKPTGLRAAAVSRNSVALTWNAVKGAPAYRVQFSTKSNMGSAKTMDVVDNYLEWNYLDPDPAAGNGGKRLSANKTYYFRVKVISAVDLDHDAKTLTSYGSKLKVKTGSSSSLPHLAPALLKATQRSATSMYLSWASRGPGVSYKVRYGTSASALSESRVFAYSGGVLDGLKAGTTYHYQVTTVSSDSKATALSKASATASFTTPGSSGSPAIKVATYNICSYASGCWKYAQWEKRRELLAKSIATHAPDLMSLQEASKSADLMAYVNSTYERNLKVVSRSSHAELAYDADRFTLGQWDEVSQPGDSSKNSVWAELTDKQSGRRLFVIATHMTNSDSASAQALRPSQTQGLVDLAKANNTDNLPVVVAGDFNVSKRKADHPKVYGTMTSNGFVDPLGNPSDSRYPDSPVAAEHRIDIGYASANQYYQKAPRAKWSNGYDVDYIWVSAGVRVGLFQKVIDLDTSGNFTGPGKGAPSDHNMLVASIHLS